MRWLDKLHYYSGLYLVLFLWLFSLTGLILNHPAWKFPQFWPSRTESTSERRIAPPRAGGDLEQARDIMRQLGVAGEIEWTETRPDADRFDFRVSRPGRMIQIKTDLRRRRASVHQIDVNGWGVAQMLHTFTGVRAADPRNSRDWMVTTLWALSMDALAAGLILMVFSSLYMWWRVKRKRMPGLVSLALGCLSCGIFVVGLRWIV